MTADEPADPLAIGVVIPARDEAARIDRCLAAVTAAVRVLDDTCGGYIDVHVVVVADACTDHTVESLARWTSVTTLVSSAGRVGSARAVGVRHVLEVLEARAVPTDRSWIANTDADSVVPARWLTVHAGASRRGAALLLGTVRPDAAEIDRKVERWWYRRHQLSDGHHHIHGANLGVRADWYLAAGGFRTVATGEDVELAAAVTAMGGAVERTGAAAVTTSARLVGRAPGGFAGYLRRFGVPDQDAPDAIAASCPA